MQLGKDKLAQAMAATDFPLVEIYDREGQLIIITTLQDFIREVFTFQMPGTLESRGPLCVVCSGVIVAPVKLRRFEGEGA